MKSFKKHVDEAILTGADNKHLEKKLDKVRDRTQKVMSQKAKSTMEEVEEADIANILREYALHEDMTAEQLANLTEEELNELIGKAIGGAFKIGAKAVVGSARLAKKGANRMSASGRADAAEKKADAMEKKNKDRERIKAARDRLRDAKKAARDK